MKRPVFKSPAFYILVVINACIIAFVVDFTQHKIIETTDSYYASREALYQKSLKELEL